MAARSTPSPLKDDKFAERRAELGEAALATLAELGYARTSLREIALNSKFSHGVLHYYFTDKLDLILCSVRQYKARCVARYDAVTAGDAGFEAVLDGFVGALAASVRNEAALHRLWYDLRAQALFEPAFRDDVAEIDKSLEKMVWRIVSHLAKISGRSPQLTSPAIYAMIDGLFQQGLARHLAGDRRAIAQMQASIRACVPQLLGVPDHPIPAARQPRTRRAA